MEKTLAVRLIRVYGTITAALRRNLNGFYCGLPVPSSLQAVEAAQLAEDLKVQLDHTQSKLKEIQVSVAENRTARERESSNLKRAQVCCILGIFPAGLDASGLFYTTRYSGVFQEDLSRLRRKLEKQKKVEMYTDADEILQEEINQYKVRENQSYTAFIHTSFRSKDVRNTTKHLAQFTSACCQQSYKSFMST